MPELPYKVYFKKINSGEIYNYVEARRAMKRRINKQETPEKTRIFFSKLEESLLEEGMRNPVIVLSVKKKKENRRFAIYDLGLDQELMLRQDVLEQAKEHLLICVESGGSRLYFAHKYNMEVPCLIVDFCDKISGEIVNSAEEALAYFKDKPQRLSYESNGIFILGANHYHMKNDDGRS